VTGLGIGIAAQSVVGQWDPTYELWPLLSSVILAVSGAWLMNIATGVRNLLSYLIGISVVAIAGLDISIGSYLYLTVATTLGAAIALSTGVLYQTFWDGD